MHKNKRSWVREHWVRNINTETYLRQKPKNKKKEGKYYTGRKKSDKYIEIIKFARSIGN